MIKFLWIEIRKLNLINTKTQREKIKKNIVFMDLFSMLTIDTFGTAELQLLSPVKGEAQ